MLTNTKTYVGYHTPAEEWLSSLSEDIKKANQPISKSQREKFSILQSNPAFILQMARIRTKFGLLTKHHEDEWEWAENLYKTQKSGKTKKDFDQEIQKLLYDFHISKRWQEAIEYYIVFNRSPKNLIPPALDFSIDADFHSITIQINRDTTLNDIKETWKEIEKNKSALRVLSDKYKTDDNKLIIKSKKLKRHTTKKEFQQYKKAFDLKQSGLNYKQIAEKLNLGKSYYSHIGVYIDRFNQIIKENELH